MRIRRYRDVLSNGIFQEMPGMRAVYDATFKICIWASIYHIFLLVRVFRRYIRSQV